MSLDRRPVPVVIAKQNKCQRMVRDGQRRCCSAPSRANDFHLNWTTGTFAALRQPLGKTFGKTLRPKPETGFHEAVGNRKSIVKVGGIGEIAHAELVQPLQGAGFALATNQNIHVKFLCVHIGMIAPQNPRQSPRETPFGAPELASRAASTLHCPDTRRKRTILPVFAVLSAFPGPPGFGISVCSADAKRPFSGGRLWKLQWKPGWIKRPSSPSRTA